MFTPHSGGQNCRCKSHSSYKWLAQELQPLFSPCLANLTFKEPALAGQLSEECGEINKSSTLLPRNWASSITLPLWAASVHYKSTVWHFQLGYLNVTLQRVNRRTIPGNRSRQNPQGEWNKFLHKLKKSEAGRTKCLWRLRKPCLHYGMPQQFFARIYGCKIAAGIVDGIFIGFAKVAGAFESLGWGDGTSLL